MMTTSFEIQDLERAIATDPFEYLNEAIYETFCVSRRVRRLQRSIAAEEEREEDE